MSDWLIDTVYSGSLLVAIPIAVIAGLLSFFSPCVLPLLPGYVSYMTGITVQDLGSAGRFRLIAGSLLFVLGFTVVFVLSGALFGYIGLQLRMYEREFSIGAGVFVIALGFVFMGVIPRFQRAVKIHAIPAAGLGVAPLLGALFGLGWVPCISPTLGAVLALAGAEGTATRGALLSFVYSLGLGVPFVVAALSFRRSLTAFPWLRGKTRSVSVAGGVLLVIVGVVLAAGWYESLIYEIRDVVGTGKILI